MEILELYVFVLAAFVGYMVITRVPPLLHTPLMAATNAISGISLVGSLIAAGAAHSRVATILGFIAVICATSNIVGGFLITDRMLKMFQSGKKDAIATRGTSEGSPADAVNASRKRRRPLRMTASTLIQVSYLIASVLFILGLRSLTRPDRARRGMQMAAFGMLFAIAGTLLNHTIVDYRWIVAGLVIGVVIGYPMGMWVPMTAMPQRIALSLTFSALAATLVGVAEFYTEITSGGTPTHGKMAALGFEIMLGSITVGGTIIAAGKLQEWITSKPVTYKGQNLVNALFFLGIASLFVYTIVDPSQRWAFYTMMVASFVFGIMLVLPIGGADMPVVVAL